MLLYKNRKEFDAHSLRFRLSGLFWRQFKAFEIFWAIQSSRCKRKLLLPHPLSRNQHYVHTIIESDRSVYTKSFRVDCRIGSAVVVFSCMTNAIKRTTTIYRSIAMIISLIWTHTYKPDDYFTISHCLVLGSAVFFVFFLLERYIN